MSKVSKHTCNAATEDRHVHLLSLRVFRQEYVLRFVGRSGPSVEPGTMHVYLMNEARLSHLPFWGPSEAVLFLI